MDEDLHGNLAKVSEIARWNCNGCADYHISFVARRLARSAPEGSNDRSEFGQLVAERLSRLATSAAPIDVLIAGSADSGVTAIVAKAALAAGRGIFGRTRITVFDRCGTPIELVRNYARETGIDVTALPMDLLQPTRAFEADLICAHSLFRHIERRHHDAVLRQMVQWLKPGGAIVLSSRIGTRSREAHLKRREEEEMALSRMISRGEVSLTEPPVALMARIERDGQFARYSGDYELAESWDEMFREAGLVIVDRRTKLTARGSTKKLTVLERDRVVPAGTNPDRSDQ